MSGCSLEHTHATRSDRCPACGHTPQAISMLQRDLEAASRRADVSAVLPYSSAEDREFILADPALFQQYVEMLETTASELERTGQVHTGRAVRTAIAMIFHLRRAQQSKCSVTDEMVAVALNEYHHRSGSERRDISFEFQRQNYPDLVDGMRRALEAALGTQQAKDSQ